MSLINPAKGSAISGSAPVHFQEGFGVLRGSPAIPYQLFYTFLMRKQSRFSRFRSSKEDQIVLIPGSFRVVASSGLGISRLEDSLICDLVTFLKKARFFHFLRPVRT